jgi:hypothetical protein
LFICLFVCLFVFIHIFSGLIDRVIHLETPSSWSEAKRLELLAHNASTREFGGDVRNIASQFFTETYKRELGRAAAATAGCTHFMTMDCDEFYLADQLRAAKRFILRRKLVATACRMRLYFKEPTVELLPLDELNAVPFIVELDAESRRRYRLAVPTSGILLDPTRSVDFAPPVELLPRSLVEMHHLTFVRKDIRSKLTNVSNRQNYDSDVDTFVEQFAAWRQGDPVIHPHPAIRRLFTHTALVPNHFHVDLFDLCAACSSPLDLMRCAACRLTRYCSVEHQRADWSRHRDQCRHWYALECNANE